MAQSATTNPVNGDRTAHGEIDPEMEPLADETAHQAQRVVAAYSSDAEELRTLLDMLGIGPKVPDEA